MLVLSAICLSGCVQRTMYVNSEPPGAIVYMNDQEVGRTPLQRDFTWYGTYDVQVRKEGYETLSTKSRVIAPWWQWPPIDLIAEFMPWRPTDHQRLFYHLDESAPGAANPSEILANAEQMRGMLMSSEHTRSPATRPTTQSAR